MLSRHELRVLTQHNQNEISSHLKQREINYDDSYLASVIDLAFTHLTKRERGLVIDMYHSYKGEKTQYIFHEYISGDEIDILDDKEGKAKLELAYDRIAKFRKWKASSDLKGKKLETARLTYMLDVIVGNIEAS